MEEGYIKYWKESNGYGFIGRRREKDLFCHISEMPQGYTPREGDRVIFEVETDQYGRLKATHVEFVW